MTFTALLDADDVVIVVALLTETFVLVLTPLRAGRI